MTSKFTLTSTLKYAGVTKIIEKGGQNIQIMVIFIKTQQLLHGLQLVQKLTSRRLAAIKRDMDSL